VWEIVIVEDQLIILRGFSSDFSFLFVEKKAPPIIIPLLVQLERCGNTNFIVAVFIAVPWDVTQSMPDIGLGINFNGLMGLNQPVFAHRSGQCFDLIGRKASDQDHPAGRNDFFLPTQIGTPNVVVHQILIFLEDLLDELWADKIFNDFHEVINGIMQIGLQRV